MAWRLVHSSTDICDSNAEQCGTCPRNAARMGKHDSIHIASGKCRLRDSIATSDCSVVCRNATLQNDATSGCASSSSLAVPRSQPPLHQRQYTCIEYHRRDSIPTTTGISTASARHQHGISTASALDNNTTATGVARGRDSPSPPGGLTARCADERRQSHCHLQPTLLRRLPPQTRPR